MEASRASGRTSVEERMTSDKDPLFLPGILPLLIAVGCLVAALAFMARPRVEVWVVPPTATTTTPRSPRRRRRQRR